MKRRPDASAILPSRCSTGRPPGSVPHGNISRIELDYKPSPARTGEASPEGRVEIGDSSGT
ncbi:hypothetical protein PtB15_3B63 [Puccinia triticina]|nr:hypothetical protein PtB15_3B63 [Puccinia triticina]